MKSIILVQTIVLCMAFGAHASENADYELTSSECSDTYHFLNLTDNKPFTVKAETKSSFVEWLHNGSTYHLEFTGADSSGYMNPTNIQLSILQLTKDAQGRISQVQGTINQTLVSSTDTSSLTQVYESTSEYPSDEQVIQHFIIDGKSLDPITSTRKKLPNGDVEISRTNTNVDESGEFRILSTDTKCIYKVNQPTELSKLFPSLGEKAVRSFTNVIQDDQNRDLLWSHLIDTKAAQKAVAASAAKSSSRISVDADVRKSGSRVWENPRLRQMLYGNSPMGRFRFCSLGC